MPEGHTIHRLARDHSAWLEGQKLSVTSPQGRFAEGARRLNGRRLAKVEAHGKHLLYFWSGRREALHVHLGLYGKFRQARTPAPPPRGAVRLRLQSADRVVDLHGPTACELLTPKQQQTLLQRLGPDPLRADADPRRVHQRISRSRAAIGRLLLDQSVIAGVGNVYRAEVLHALGVHPERPGNELSQQELDALWRTLQQWLRIGVKYNRIITADPELVGKTPGRMTRAERLLAYKQAICPRCGSAIEDWMLGARRIYACTSCQK